MKYKKAQDILPRELIEKLQDFVDGAYLYIPKREGKKKAWGENTKTKEELGERNEKIYKDFKKGLTVGELAECYYLAPNSIRRILRN